MSTRLVFTGKQQVASENFELPPIAAGEVRMKTLYSLMSTGTETIVFDRRFDAGTHWDRWVKYPFHPGYAAVGEVEAVGEGVTTLKVGDRIACRKFHASRHNVGVDKAYRIPDNMDIRLAAWFAIAKITFMSAKAAQYRLGSSVLVIGAGPIGQMSLRWAIAAGAEPVFVADMVPFRLELAKAGGASGVFAESADKISEPLQAANGGQLPEYVIDSTGNAQVFQAALSLAREFGKVVLIGDTGSPASQHLSPALMRGGLSVIGAHDRHVTPEWPEKRIVELFFRLASSGRINLQGLNTHTFEPAACKDAYNLALNAREKTMGILFDWTKVE